MKICRLPVFHWKYRQATDLYITFHPKVHYVPPHSCNCRRCFFDVLAIHQERFSFLKKKDYPTERTRCTSTLVWILSVSSSVQGVYVDHNPIFVLSLFEQTQREKGPLDYQRLVLFLVLSCMSWPLSLHQENWGERKFNWACGKPQKLTSFVSPVQQM